MAEFQQVINAPHMDQVELFEFQVDSLSPDAPAKIKVLGVKPKNLSGPASAYIYAHGGGGIACDAKSHEPLMNRWARENNCITYSVDYRLGPEHKAPIQGYDMLGAIKHIYENAESLGVDNTRIVIGGDSGGSWVAALASYLLAKNDMTHMVKLMILRCP